MRATAAILEALERLGREGRVVERRPAAPAPAVELVSEKEFQAAVEELARRRGWKVYHAFDSRKSERGWPDLFLCRGARAVAAELKVGDSRPTAAQLGWLEALALAGVETHVWLPSDWTRIMEILE